MTQQRIPPGLCHGILSRNLATGRHLWERACYGDMNPLVIGEGRSTEKASPKYPKFAPRHSGWPAKTLYFRLPADYRSPSAGNGNMLPTPPPVSQAYCPSPDIPRNAEITALNLGILLAWLSYITGVMEQDVKGSICIPL